MIVQKRDGRPVRFDSQKIISALSKAFVEIDGEVTEKSLKIINTISADMADLLD